MAKININRRIRYLSFVKCVHCKKNKTRNPWVGSYKPRVSIQIPSNFNQERGIYGLVYEYHLLVLKYLLLVIRNAATNYWCFQSKNWYRFKFLYGNLVNQNMKLVATYMGQCQLFVLIFSEKTQKSFTFRRQK